LCHIDKNFTVFVPRPEDCVFVTNASNGAKSPKAKAAPLE
jgi:hypothetical protein